MREKLPGGFFPSQFSPIKKESVIKLFSCFLVEGKAVSLKNFDRLSKTNTTAND